MHSTADNTSFTSGNRAFLCTCHSAHQDDGTHRLQAFVFEVNVFVETPHIAPAFLYSVMQADSTVPTVAGQSVTYIPPAGEYGWGKIICTAYMGKGDFIYFYCQNGDWMFNNLQVSKLKL